MAAKKRKRKPSTGKSRGVGQSFALTPTKLQLAHPDPAKQKALSAFLRHGTVSAACGAAQIGRTTWYEWLRVDEVFARLAGEAHAVRKDALEAEAEKRAIKGSDTLLIFLLKAANPDKYRDRRVITEVNAEVRMRVNQTLQLIASKAQWDSDELINALNEVWK